MKGPSCLFENPDHMNFCGNCGNPLSVKCPECSHNNRAGSESCDLCGGRLPPPSLPAYAKRPPEDYTPPFLKKEILKVAGSLEGERKMVSVLFADVTGFTSMSENLDPEDVHEIMDGCFDILGKEIHGAGGSINQYTGDGVMALFGAPMAYEDHIERACYAALRIQTRMKGCTARIERDYGVHFQLRIGIHAGKVVVGAIGIDLRLDYTAAGDTTNLAARLEARAHPGGILVSKRVREAAKLFFRFRRAGGFVLKGKRKAVLAYTLLGERKSVRLSKRDAYKPAPFVNRKDELAVMKRALKAVIEGKPRLVSVEGEAGAGKSRLLSVFQDSVIDENILFLKGHCRPYGEATAFYPLGSSPPSELPLSGMELSRCEAKSISLYPLLYSSSQSIRRSFVLSLYLYLCAPTSTLTRCQFIASPSFQVILKYLIYPNFIVSLWLKNVWSII